MIFFSKDALSISCDNFVGESQELVLNRVIRMNGSHGDGAHRQWLENFLIERSRFFDLNTSWGRQRHPQVQAFIDALLDMPDAHIAIFRLFLESQKIDYLVFGHEYSFGFHYGRYLEVRAYKEVDAKVVRDGRFVRAVINSIAAQLGLETHFRGGGVIFDPTLVPKSLNTESVLKFFKENKEEVSAHIRGNGRRMYTVIIGSEFYTNGFTSLTRVYIRYPSFSLSGKFNGSRVLKGLRAYRRP